MNILFSVFTNYQLIVAIQLKLKMFNNDNSDIMIHDHSSGYEEIAHRLNETDIFNNIFVINSLEPSSSPTFTSKITRTINILLNKDDIIKNTVNISLTKYDLFLFYNYNYFNTSLYYQLKNKYQNILVKRFEEGYGSLLDFESKGLISSSVILQKRFEKIHKVHSLKEINEIYAFEPGLALYKDKYTVYPIPKLNSCDNKVKNTLNYIFNYNENNLFTQKYIFFEESYFADGIDIDDLELVLKIAEHVGKDNLMVKLHPRNSVDRFSELGIKTIGQSGIPWEVIIMNHDFTNNVFLTIASSCVFSPRIIFGESVPTFMLYNCTNVMPPLLKNENFKKFIDKFKKKYGSDGFYIPKNRNEFLNLLQNDI